MQKCLTESLHAVCRAVLNALSDAVPGEILACDLVQVDHREFRFQTVAAAHFANGQVRRLLLGCEERLAQHFDVALAGGDGTAEHSPMRGLESFCRRAQSSLADSGIPWASTQDFRVHDREQFRVHCDGVRNFLFRVAVAEGRLDLVIDLAPRLLGCEWLTEEISRGGRTQVGSGEESIGSPDVVRRIMGYLAGSGADVQVKMYGDGDRLELLQATFLSHTFEVDDGRLALTCARRTSLERAEDVPEKVTLVFILQDKLLQCNCPVISHDHLWLDDDITLPVLELGLPATVTYGQRRGAFRLEPPERIQGTVQRINESTVEDGFDFASVPVRVQDISFTGAKLLLGSNALISCFKGGSSVKLSLRLPGDFGDIELTGVVRRLHIAADDATRRGACLGLEFADSPDCESLSALRRYIQDRHTSRLSTGSAELEIG